MNARLKQLLSPTRVAAELLARLGYRRFQAIYWKLRSADMAGRYRYEEDFPVLAKIITDRSIRGVLDIGCGFGRLFDVYRRSGVKEVTAFEISESLFEAASKHASSLAAASPDFKIRVEKRDLRDSLPTLGSVDLVVSNRVLQHIHPGDVSGVVSGIARTGAKWIYINDLLGGTISAPYTFVHNYQRLFSTHGYEVELQGTIPVLNHEYLLLKLV